jgi:hypothetical protein
MLLQLLERGTPQQLCAPDCIKACCQGGIECIEVGLADVRLVEAVRREAAAVRERVSETDFFKQLVVASKGKRRPEISAFANMVWTLEHEALMMAWEATGNDLRCIFVFDGMLVPRVSAAGIERAFTERTREAFPRIQWVIKPWK